jgi:hypothetical protein
MAGSLRGIAPPELPQIRTCTFVHTARHVMCSLRDGTQCGSQSVAEAGSAPETVGTYPTRVPRGFRAG